MKNILLTIALVFTVFASAQELETPVAETEVATKVAEEPTFYINEVLKPYVSTFAAGMAADGWDISSTKKHDVFILFDYEIDEQFTDKAGIALGMFDDEKVFVIISVTAWLELEEYGKQDLINHELMHDIFDVEHTSKLDENKLMHPASYPKSWADTMFRFIDAINDLNEASGYE